ncbi:unnamed protein product [Rotaria sp. Silwood2]|nr:unnamed protein product [Rotaria sp. Silwood2]
MAAGSTNNPSSEINVVIIGETGTGKSTFINYLTNLFYNGSLTNLKVAIPTRYLKANMPSIIPQHHEACLNDVTRSKTGKCTKYTFTVEQVHFNFFDTPGINDTGGYLSDNENVDRIFECIQTLQHITALVLVLNGTQARLTVNIRNVLERFRDRIPDIIYRNVIVILTNCAPHTVNFGSVKLLNHAPIFHMQNSAFSSDAQAWTSQTREILQRDWSVSMQTMNDFIKTLLTLTAISTESLSAMNDDRNAIRSVLHESRLMIMELQHIEDELTALEQASNIYSANIEKYASTSGQPTKSIQAICHERCSLTETTRVGERVLRRCTVIVNGRCTVCVGKCSYDIHYHDRRLIKSVPRTLKVAISSMANKYTEARKDKAACETKCETVQETKRVIEQSLQEQFIKVRDACLRVKSNCQGFNVAEELCMFVNFLKNDMSSLRSPSITRKAAKFVEKLEALADDLQDDDSLISIIEPPSTLGMHPPMSPPLAAKRKTANNNNKQALKASQLQPTSTGNDDLILINPSPTSSLIAQVDHILNGSFSSLNVIGDIPSAEDDEQRKKKVSTVAISDSFLRSQSIQQQQPPSDSNNSRNYAEYSTERLVVLSRESTEEYKLIAKELNRRCGGTSIGYLTPAQLSILCEYYASSRTLQLDELIRVHSQLQLDIQQLTDHDPFEILSVPTEKLLHLAAVSLYYRFALYANFMTSNPIMAAAHQVKETISDAMSRLGVGGNQYTMKNNENNDTRHLSLDTSNIAKVLVIGETGSGKSTFINYLTNYFRGGSLQNIKVAIPSKFHPTITEQFSHCENNIRDTTQSKTDMCNQYIFVDTASPAQKQYIFLDTPGLSDTRGAEQDNINMNKIIDGVESLGGLSAVIIVVNGTTGRLTLNLRNVIARLRGNLPDVVMDNVIVVLTNAKRHEANFNISSLQLHGTVYPYYMQNSAFSQDSNTWDQAALDALQFDWDASMDELKRMIETIDTFKIKSVTAFKDMKDIRNAIKALMHEARLEVSHIQKMQDELAAFEHALKQYKTDEVTYKDYTRERVVETKELVDTKYHSTVCRKCDHVCHDKCGLHETTTHGNRIFQRCWAMSSEGQCFICPGHCLYTEHYHARKTMKVKQQKLQDVLHDIKAKYDLATRNKADFQSRITTTQDAKNMLQRALKQKLEEIKHKCAELRRICSGFNLAQELHALIDQLKAEAVMLRNIEAKQQAEEFIRSLSEFCRQLEADQVAKQVLPPMRLVDTYTSKPFRSSTSSTTTTAPPSQISPSENTPNLNTSVLDLITRLNKPKKPLPPTSDEDDDDNDENSENDDDYENTREIPSASSRSSRHLHQTDNDNNHDDEIGLIHDRRKRRQLPLNNNNNSNNNNTNTNTNSLQQQYAILTTTELVQRYTDCKDARKSNAILIELNRRSQGKSTGPLVSPTDIGTFARYTQLYGSQDAPTLSHLYLQLQQRISNMTEPDILNIIRVPGDLLLEISAIYTLIAQKNQQQQQGQNADGNFANESAFERPPDHIASSMMMKMSTPTSQTSMGYFSPPASHHPGGATITTPTSPNTFFKPIQPTNMNNVNIQPAALQTPIFSLLTSSTQQQQQHQQQQQQQQSPQQQQSSLSFAGFTGYHTGSGDGNSISSQFQFQKPPPPPPPSFVPSSSSPSSSTTMMPMSTTIRSDRSVTDSPFTFVSPPSSNVFESTFAFVTPTTTTASKDDYAMINIAPLPNIITDDDITNGNTLTNTDITHLLTLYNDAKLSNKNAQLFAIYQELERRCTGVNCNQLTKDYPAVYETKLNEHAHKTLSELKQTYSNIQQQIRVRINNDATHINDVPKELIIESAALLATIKQKETYI